MLKRICLLLVFVFPVSIASAQKYAPINSVNKIIENYLAVKNSLAADDATAAARSAKELLNILSSEPGKALKPGQQKILNNYIDKLQYDSRHISEVSMIDHQREHFASLSKNLFDMLERLKMNTTTLYEQYCPMKKAYWLSDAETVKNPYYGKKMPECGRVAATLASVSK